MTSDAVNDIITKLFNQNKRWGFYYPGNPLTELTEPVVLFERVPIGDGHTDDVRIYVESWQIHWGNQIYQANAGTQAVVSAALKASNKKCILQLLFCGLIIAAIIGGVRLYQNGRKNALSPRTSSATIDIPKTSISAANFYQEQTTKRM